MNAFAARLAADPARIVAWHERRPVAAAEFLAHARTLAAAWPPGARVVNVCEQRYAFLVGFAAALLRGGHTLLPPSRAPAVVAEVVVANPGAIVCTDEDVPHAPDPGARTLDAPLGELACIGYTSGSTGRPRAFPKRWEAFLMTTATNSQRIAAAVGGAFARAPSIVATVPSQHMYGIETTVLLPLAGGMAVHGGRPLFPAEIAGALDGVPEPRVLVTTPVHLRTLVESRGTVERWPRVAAIVSATAPLDAELAQAAEELLGAVLVEMFGATETCVFATRRTAVESAWLLQPGVRLESTADGTLVHAPWLAGPVPLQDHVETRADATFRVIGRDTDLVEVAGKRASLQDLTRRIREVPGVVDAIAFQTDPLGAAGVRRIAALVVAPGRDAAAIRRDLARAMDPVFLPRPLVLVDALPHNEVGKLPRERLLAAIRRAPPAELQE